MAGRSGTENLILIGIGILGLSVLAGVASLYTFYAKVDNDGDGKNGIFDNDDTSSGGKYTYTNLKSNITGAPKYHQPYNTYVLTFGVDVDKDGKFSEPGDVEPSLPDLKDNQVPLPIVITSLDMDTKLGSSSRLYNKIYVLPAATAFKARVGVYVDRDIPLPTKIELKLLEGNLGALAHTPNNNVRLIGTKDLPSGLKKGANVIELDGITPVFNPGHDWHLAQAVIYVDGVLKGDKTFWRGDEHDKPKWTTLQYFNDFCALPKEVFLEECIDSTFGASTMTIKFNLKDATWLGEILKRVEVYELTYPGKYKLLYSGRPEISSGGLKERLASIFEISVPYSDFATISANEGYIKIIAYDGNDNRIDLNTAGADDIAARINIDVDVNGGSMWKGDQEYFNVLGRRLMSVMGRGHPEAELFNR